MLYHYAPILDTCEPFVIAHRGFAPAVPREVLGVRIDEANVIDPQLREHAAFIGLLRHLDELCFGPNGMPMPSWVFYDCAVMPGGFFGFGIRADRLEAWCRDAMRVPPGYTGLVPVSQLIAIPMLAGFAATSPAGTVATPGVAASPGAASPPGLPDTPHTWLMYSLESINQVSPGFAPAGLLKLTLALGLRLFPIRTLYGTTQWRSHKLSTYVDLGPVELVTAYTPAHSLPRTLSFRVDVEQLHLETLLVAPRVHPSATPPNAWLNPDDVDALVALQRDLEGGERVTLVGRPHYYGAEVRIPLHRGGRDALAGDPRSGQEVA